MIRSVSATTRSSCSGASSATGRQGLIRAAKQASLRIALPTPAMISLVEQRVAELAPGARVAEPPGGGGGVELRPQGVGPEPGQDGVVSRPRLAHDPQHLAAGL